MEAIQHTALVAVNDLARAEYHDDLLDRVHAYLALRNAHTADIKTALCQFYCIDRHALSSRDRLYEVTYARQMFCYLAYRYTRLSLEAVGKKVGLVNHSTVLHAVRKIEKCIISKPLMADDLDLLRLKILELTVVRKGAGSC